MRYLKFPIIAGCLVIASRAALAQADSRTDILTGRITDLTGRPVADAQVGVTSLATGLKRTYTTDSDGRYRIAFPENAPRYVLLVKRVGFSPVQRTIVRKPAESEQNAHITVDLQFGGTPLALSAVEVTGNSDGGDFRRKDSQPASDATVPNPVAEILALKDTLHLSAVQIVALTDVADTLQAKNTDIYGRIRTLLAKSQEAGDVNQMAGTVAMMLQDASRNTDRAVTAAEKLLRPEQWLILPQVIRDRAEAGTNGASQAKQ
jgi:hypothetical protein